MVHGEIDCEEQWYACKSYEERYIIAREKYEPQKGYTDENNEYVSKIDRQISEIFFSESHGWTEDVKGEDKELQEYQDGKVLECIERIERRKVPMERDNAVYPETP